MLVVCARICQHLRCHHIMVHDTTSTDIQYASTALSDHYPKPLRLTFVGFQGSDYPESWLLPPSPPVALLIEDPSHYSIMSTDAREEWATSAAAGTAYVRLGPNYRTFGVSMFHQVCILLAGADWLRWLRRQRSSTACVTFAPFLQATMNLVKTVISHTGEQNTIKTQFSC